MVKKHDFLVTKLNMNTLKIPEIVILLNEHAFQGFHFIKFKIKTTKIDSIYTTTFMSETFDFFNTSKTPMIIATTFISMTMVNATS